MSDFFHPLDSHTLDLPTGCFAKTSLLGSLRVALLLLGQVMLMTDETTEEDEDHDGKEEGDVRRSIPQPGIELILIEEVVENPDNGHHRGGDECLLQGGEADPVSLFDGPPDRRQDVSLDPFDESRTFFWVLVGVFRHEGLLSKSFMILSLKYRFVKQNLPSVGEV